MNRLSSFAFAAALSLGAAGQAAAADLPAMPVKAPPPVVIVYNWSGVYVGGFAGILWADKDWTFLNGATTSPNPSGFIGGAQVGVNWQVSSWVLGIQADWGWSSADGSTACPNATFTCKSEVKHLGSLTGRLGYAWSNALLYVKGGAAWVRDEYTATSAGATFTGSNNPWGWTVGTGLEYGFTPNWSVFVEYDYYNFGTKRIVFTGPGGATDNFDVKQSVSVVKLGVNYRFNWIR